MEISAQDGAVRVPQNRLFSIQNPVRVPDGTIVYPFLSPKDITSGLPWDLLDGFSLAGGEIEGGGSSKIHIMPLVTQVTFVLSGQLRVRMKEPTGGLPYTVNLRSDQAVLTKPGTFFQLINPTTEKCRVLYIVSPPYLFDSDPEGNIRYDDSVVLDEDWDELKRIGWTPSRLVDQSTAEERRRSAYDRLATRAP